MGGRTRDSHHPCPRRRAASGHARSHSSTGQSIRLSTGRLRVRVPLAPLHMKHTAVAQWTRAPRYERGGRAFESRRRYGWTRSSVGRAPCLAHHLACARDRAGRRGRLIEFQSGGRGFESRRVHPLRSESVARVVRARGGPSPTARLRAGAGRRPRVIDWTSRFPFESGRSPPLIGAHGYWPRATGSRSATSGELPRGLPCERAAPPHDHPMARRGRDRAGIRRRGAGTKVPPPRSSSSPLVRRVDARRSSLRMRDHATPRRRQSSSA